MITIKFVLKDQKLTDSQDMMSMSMCVMQLTGKTEQKPTQNRKVLINVESFFVIASISNENAYSKNKKFKILLTFQLFNTQKT